MKPNFALNLSTEGIGLLHRVGDGWQMVGEVSPESADLARELDFLRRTAAGLEPGGITTKLVIPNSQILYRTIEVASTEPQEQADAVRAAMEGATPYALDQLAIDWQPAGTGRIAIAACARETLREAETFAEENRFNPVCFVACPDGSRTFPAEPFFGEARAAETLLDPGTRVERESAPVPVTPEPVTPPPEPEPAATAPESEPEAAPGPATPPPPDPPPVPPPGDATFDEGPPTGTPAKDTPKPRRQRLGFLAQAEAMPARSQIILGLLLIALALVLWVTVVMRETITSWILPGATAPPAAVSDVATALPAPVTRQVPRDRPSSAETASAAPAIPAGMTPQPADTVSGTTLAGRPAGGPAATAPAPARLDIARGASLAARRAAGKSSLPARELSKATRLASGTRPGTALAVVPDAGPRPGPPDALVRAVAGNAALLAELKTAGAPSPAVSTRMRAETATPFRLAARTDAKPLRVTGKDVTPPDTPAAPPAGSLLTASAGPPDAPTADTPSDAAASTAADGSPAQPQAPGAAAGAPDTTEAPVPAAPAGNQMAALAPAAPGPASPASPASPAGPESPADPAAPPQSAEPTAPDTGPGAIDAATTAVAVAMIRPPLVPGRGDLLDTPPENRIAMLRPPLRPAPPPVASDAMDAAVSAALDSSNAEAAADAEVASDVAALRPRRRPSNVGQQNAVTASGASVAPRVPSKASVAREATDKSALRMQRVTLLGVLGSPKAPSALVKVGSSVQKLKVGDSVDGGTVVAISSGTLVYVKSGRKYVLQMPAVRP